MIPEWSAPSSSSRSERIIPRESSPRSFASPSGSSAPGSSAPGRATATVAPAPKFQAPQTICRGSPSPTSTRQSWSRSAFGCLPASTTFPTWKSPWFPCASETPVLMTWSTSREEIARRRASSSTGTSTSTYSRSQESGTRMPSSELRQQSRVVAPELAQVGDPVAEHGNPLEPPAEREARVAPGVVADELVEGRIDHPRAADLDPAGVPADRAAAPVADVAGDVRLDRRLGEGEVVRPELRPPL